MTKNFNSTLKIETNQETFKGISNGKLHLPTGEIVVTHNYETIPHTFDLAYLTVGALTGTPEPERALDDKVSNPFSSAKKYSFIREVEFIGHRERLKVIGGYEKVSETENKGYLEFVGEVPKGSKIVSVEPTVETWIPGNEVGTIDGQFMMSWLNERNERTLGIAKTTYKLEECAKINKFTIPHFRFITIQFLLTGTKYRQEEQISMFTYPQGHIEDIEVLDKEIK